MTSMPMGVIPPHDPIPPGRGTRRSRSHDCDRDADAVSPSRVAEQG
jgi:hypothetical protein